MTLHWPLFKLASTALTRRIAQGVLSPKAINQAASAMPQGSFRFLGNLGRGQFSLADKVVGNMGPGAVGQMVRKVPTRAVSGGIEGQFGPLASHITDLNKQFSRFYQANPIAPYAHVGPRGAFQQLADGRVWRLPQGLRKSITDLHQGNIGPRGQVFDFASKAHAPLPWGTPVIDPASGFSITTDKGRRLIDDLMANRQVVRAVGDSHLRQTPTGQAVLSNMAGQQRFSDNLIRRYWGSNAKERSRILFPEGRDAVGSRIRRDQLEGLAVLMDSLNRLPRSTQNPSGLLDRFRQQLSSGAYDHYPAATLGAGAAGTALGVGINRLLNQQPRQ